jgi:hypothetical protein
MWVEVDETAIHCWHKNTIIKYLIHMGLILGVVKTNMLSACLSMTGKDIGTVYIAKIQKKRVWA